MNTLYANTKIIHQALYVNKGSELSQHKANFEQTGFEVYRSRMLCECTHGSNRRNGILVLDTCTPQTLVLKVMRCKACEKKHREDMPW